MFALNLSAYFWHIYKNDLYDFGQKITKMKRGYQLRIYLFRDNKRPSEDKRQSDCRF